MLDLHRLRILVAVAEHGSLRGAADSLSYTRAAISQQIGVLERELGTAVIERHARGVVLTEVGKVLAGRGVDLLRRLDDIEAEVEAIGRLEAGSLRIGAFASAIAGIIPPALDVLRQRFPGLELALVEGEPDELVPRLLRRELNLALVFHADDDRWLENQGVELIPLLEDPMLVALSRRHPLAERPSLRFADFRDEAWVQGTRGACFDILRQACSAAGFEPRVPFDCDSYDSIQQIVAAGLGVALVPDMALREARPEVCLRTLGPETPLRLVSAIVVAEAYRTPATIAACRVLREVAATYRERREAVRGDSLTPGSSSSTN